MKHLIGTMSIALALACACSTSDDAADTALPSTPDDDGRVAAEPDAATETRPAEETKAPDAGSPDAATPSCTAARAQLLGPVDEVSDGAVTVLEEDGAVATIYVDAAAGGAQAASQNPRVYVNLGTRARVDVSDVSAETSTGWDLALKRPVLFTNSGHGGPGGGGAVFLPGADFATVTAANAATATFGIERFYDDDCNAVVDRTGAVKTTFDGWYDYDQATNRLSPTPGTWIVRGGQGALYKVQILTYYAAPDGTAAGASGRYTLRVAPL